MLEIKPLTDYLIVYLLLVDEVELFDTACTPVTDNQLEAGDRPGWSACLLGRFSLAVQRKQGT